MFSTDKNILRKDSVAQKRMIDYGKLVKELHILVLSKGKNRIAESGQVEMGNSICVYPISSRWGWLCFWRAYKVGGSIISKYCFNVETGIITTQDPFETGLVGYCLKLKFKLPLQLQIHTDFLSPYFSKESLKNRLRVIMGKTLVSRVDGLRVVSDRIRKSLLSFSSKIKLSQIIVLPIAVDVRTISDIFPLVDLHQKYSGYGFIVLMASRLTIEKNIAMAIKAMKAVVQTYPQVLLLIVGDGPKRQELMRLIQKLQLQNNIIFESWTNDLFSYYKTADLFLLTSNYEGGARAPAEAMAAGLPVVMTDVAPAQEVVLNDINGFVVPVGDYLFLSRSIMELISDTIKRDSFSDQAKKTAQGFLSKEQYLIKYQTALEGLIKKK